MNLNMTMLYSIFPTFLFINNLTFIQERDDFNNVVSGDLIMIDILIYAILCISIGLNIYLLVFKNSRSHKSSSRKSEVDYEQWYHREKNNALKLKNDNLSLKNKLYKTQGNTVAAQKSPMDISSQIIQNPSNSETNIQPHYEDEKPTTIDFKVDNSKPKVIYLPSPFEDRRFSFEDITYERDQNSLYLINLDVSENKGSLTIVQNADLTRAINSPDQYLEKACIYENAFNPNASQLQVIEKGKVQLQERDWIITEKIKIKFV